MTRSATLYPYWYIEDMSNSENTTNIHRERIGHEVTFTVTQHQRNTLSPYYTYKLMVRAECKECGWSNYLVRNCDATVQTEANADDKYELLVQHHEGISI